MKKIILIGILFVWNKTLFAQNNTSTIRALTTSQESIEWYSFLHQNPELSTQEVQTSAYLKEKVRGMGYTIVDSLGYHSFAAILRNGKGPTLLYRTDMDGLPVQEATGWSIASTKTALKDDKPSPVMHACGHDLHMSTWLNVARVMRSLKKDWKGTLILIAQSAEEVGKGAKGIFAAPAWKTLPKADRQLAFHTQSSLEVGQMGFCDGYAMAAVDMMTITLHGKGGHGAEPQKTIDPIVLAANYILELQTIVSRNLGPNDPTVVTVGAINGGTVGNVIPNEVTLKLTLRSYSSESRALLLQRIRTIGDHLAYAAGLDASQLPTYELLDMSIPPVYNDPTLGGELRRTLAPSFTLVTVPATMIGEDFGLYSQQQTVPSYLIWMGVLAPSQKEGYLHNALGIPTLHSARFAPDYTHALPKATEAMVMSLLQLFHTTL